MHRRRTRASIHICRYAQTVSALRSGDEKAWCRVGMSCTDAYIYFAKAKVCQPHARCDLTYREGSIAATLAWNTYRHMECW